MKNLNKVRDMSHAKYTRIIKGDEIQLRRIALIYSDFDHKLINRKSYKTIYVDDEYGYYEDIISEDHYELVFHVDMETWDHMVKNLGLKLNKEVRQKREWRIA